MSEGLFVVPIATALSESSLLLLFLLCLPHGTVIPFSFAPFILCSLSFSLLSFVHFLSAILFLLVFYPPLSAHTHCIDHPQVTFAAATVAVAIN